MWYQIVLEHWN